MFSGPGLVDNAKLTKSCFGELVHVGIQYATKRELRTHSAVYISACTLCPSFNACLFPILSYQLATPNGRYLCEHNDGGIHTYSLLRWYGVNPSLSVFKVLTYIYLSQH